METGPARTLEAAERIRRQMVARPLRPADGKKPRVTLLVGVATFTVTPIIRTWPMPPAGALPGQAEGGTAA
ncbi:hypothetical protein ACFQU2_00855 [Siccirubricoccus deserti]